jgi:hypothetical protein
MNGSRHNLLIVAESAYGTTPTTPALKTLPITGTTLALSKETFQSQILRSDRQISDFRHGTKQVGGEINVELKAIDFDDVLQALLGGTWTEDVLKAGTTRRSFTLIREFADSGDATKFHRFTGVEFNTLKLNATPGGIVTATLGVIGKGLSLDAAKPTDSTTAEANATQVFDAFGGTVKEGGSTIAVVTELSLNLDNGMGARFVVGSAETLQPSQGRSNLTGQVTAYFEDHALLNKFINETESSLQFTLTDGTNSYEILVPRIVYSGGQPDVSGEGPVTLAMPFQALLDSDTTDTNIQITRTIGD